MEANTLRHHHRRQQSFLSLKNTPHCTGGCWRRVNNGEHEKFRAERAAIDLVVSVLWNQCWLSSVLYETCCHDSPVAGHMQDRIHSWRGGHAGLGTTLTGISFNYAFVGSCSWLAFFLLAVSQRWGERGLLPSGLPGGWKHQTCLILIEDLGGSESIGCKERNRIFLTKIICGQVTNWVTPQGKLSPELGLIFQWVDRPSWLKKMFQLQNE